jgi:hypothetical protein
MLPKLLYAIETVPVEAQLIPAMPFPLEPLCVSIKLPIPDMFPMVFPFPLYPMVKFPEPLTLIPMSGYPLPVVGVYFMLAIVLPEITLFPDALTEIPVMIAVVPDKLSCGFPQLVVEPPM